MTQHQEAQPGSTPQPEPTAAAPGSQRPGNVVLAGAGSVLAVLAFLGGMAVGHSWDGTSNQQNQFGGPGRGGGFQGNGQGPGTQQQPGTTQNG
jgi:hypothetical protein